MARFVACFLTGAFACLAYVLAVGYLCFGLGMSGSGSKGLFWLTTACLAGFACFVLSDERLKG